MKQKAPFCGECEERTKLTTGLTIYPHRPDLAAKFFYICGCGAYVGCHPGTQQPLGRPASATTRKARSAAHTVFDSRWKDGSTTRKAAYAWLAEKMEMAPEKCHIGMMNAEEARRVTALCMATDFAEFV